MRCPRPCRGRNTTSVAPTRPTRSVSDGSPQGVETRLLAHVLDAGQIVDARPADDPQTLPLPCLPPCRLVRRRLNETARHREPGFPRRPMRPWTSGHGDSNHASIRGLAHRRMRPRWRRAPQTWSAPRPDPRPVALVAGLEDGPLKRELAACTDASGPPHVVLARPSRRTAALSRNTRASRTSPPRRWVRESSSAT